MELSRQKCTFRLPNHFFFFFLSRPKLPGVYTFQSFLRTIYWEQSGCFEEPRLMHYSHSLYFSLRCTSFYRNLQSRVTGGNFLGAFSRPLT